MDWLAQLLGLPRGLARPHRGHGVDLDGRRARRRADASAGRRRLRVGAGELQRREGGAARRARVPQGRGRRRVPHAHRLPARRRDRGRRDGRHDGDDVGRPGARARAPLRGGGRLAARRRGLRRRGGGLPRAALVPRRLRARRLDRRQPAQVAVHADGLLGVLDAAPRGAPRDVRARRPTTSPRPTTPSTSRTTGRRSAAASAR